MGGVVHLGNLKNLKSLTLSMTVVVDKSAKPPWKQITQDGVEKRVWALIRGEAKSGADSEQKAADSQQRAAALRKEAEDLMREAEKLLQRAKALLDKAAVLPK